MWTKSIRENISENTCSRMITRQVSVFKTLCGCHVVPTTKNEVDIVVYWQMGTSTIQRQGSAWACRQLATGRGQRTTRPLSLCRLAAEHPITYTAASGPSV